MNQRIFLHKFQDVRHTASKLSLEPSILRQLNEALQANHTTVIFEGPQPYRDVQGRRFVAAQYDCIYHPSADSTISNCKGSDLNALVHEGVITAEEKFEIAFNKLRNNPDGSHANVHVFSTIPELDIIRKAFVECKDTAGLAIVQSARFDLTCERYRPVFKDGACVIHVILPSDDYDPVSGSDTNWDREDDQYDSIDIERTVMTVYVEFTKRCGADACVIVISDGAHISRILFNTRLQVSDDWNDVDCARVVDDKLGSVADMWRLWRKKGCSSLLMPYTM